ncbi:hypothetical protein F0562_006821 [Nyssa sinensis]|uniref:Vitamin K epoxide reductase domain-containing protein n=1 Tax=Nyssa sinensis TaxID=561372 RepID=A0A5J5ARN3_9ASTE|nr:hypothetical protein F0562_006821 [Nyssa sinensis]
MAGVVSVASPPLLSRSPSSLSSFYSFHNPIQEWLGSATVDASWLGGLGFLETSYLTFLKLTNSDAFCPIGGGTCGDILNSDYAAVFGVPLPLIGMAAYGLVTILSVYFLYILSTKFEGASCSYCLASALLSFSLFFTTLKDFGLQEIQKVVGLQLCLAGLVIATLSTSYNISQPVSTREEDWPLDAQDISILG